MPSASPYPDPIPGIIPHGSICTFAGASGVGKTAMYAGWIRAWLDEQPICDHPTHRPTQIGLLVGDRRWQSHRQWLDAVECADKVVAYSLRDDAAFPWNDLRLWPKVQDLFSRALDRLQLAPGSLIIVDPLPLWLPGKVNDYKDVAVGLGVLDRVLNPRQLTMLGVFHQSKQLADKTQQYKRPQDRILGSAAQIGFSDTAMYLLGPEDIDTPYYGFGWVPHNALAETYKFTRDAWGLFVRYTEPPDFDSIEVVFEHIPTDGLGVSVGQLHHRLEVDSYTITRRTIFRCLRKLMDDGRVMQLSRGVYARSKVS